MTSTFNLIFPVNSNARSDSPGVGCIKMNYFHDVTARAAVFVLISSLLVAGCSSSSDSPALSEDDNAVGEIDSIASTAQPEADPISSGASDEVIVSANDTIEETSELVAPDSENIPAETIDNEQNSEQTTESVPDPLVQNNTRVDFEITVPEYQSDALQVRLTWGATDVMAGWVGDEFWSVSLDLPTNNEHTLNVTFYDLNGDIELARASQQYRTGANAAEIFAVGADQFDASLFDADEDGINNLDELITGFDPFINEESLLPIEDYAPTIFLASQEFESFLTEERPLFLTFAPHPNNPDQDSLSGNLDIDAEGNGVLIRNDSSGTAYRNSSSTRTHSESSVSWEGNIRSYDGSDYTGTRNFTNTVRLVDEYTREFFEESDRRSIGTYQFTGNITSDVTGRLIDGTSLCEPVAGTYFIVDFNGVRRTRIETSISKEIDDLYWRVVEETDFIDLENGIETTEYFARELRFFTGSSQFPTGSQQSMGFLCDFVDF